MPRLFTPTLLALCLAVPSASAPPRPSHCLTATGWRQATPAEIQALLDRGAAPARFLT